MLPTNENLIAEIKAKLSRIDKMAAALNQAVIWFKGYADMHYKKGKIEKGDKNTFRADFLSSNLPNLTPSSYLFSCPCGEKYTLITYHTPGITMDCTSCGKTIKSYSAQINSNYHPTKIPQIINTTPPNSSTNDTPTELCPHFLPAGHNLSPILPRCHLIPGASHIITCSGDKSMCALQGTPLIK